MRIAVQEGLLPGRDFAEKLHNAEMFGFDAVELDGGALNDEAGREERKRALAGSRVQASSICGGIHHRFIDVEARERAQSRDSLRRQLHHAAELGAVGPIFVPIFAHNNRMPDLRPYRSRFDLSRGLCVEMLRQIDEDARAEGALAIMEPLNRYEADFLNRLEQATGMLAELPAGHHVRVLADFFHMHIEETHAPAAIDAAGAAIAHVHLADGTRKEPGSAGIDFVAAFRALRRIGFTGAMALECGLTGPRDEALPRCAGFLRRCLQESEAEAAATA